MLRIGIVDNHPVMRFGLGSLLKENFSAAVDEFAADDISIEHFVRQNYDVIFASTDSSHEFLANLKSRFASTKLIIVATTEVFHEAILHLSKWADGYVSKDSSSDTIIKAFQTVVLERSRFVSQAMLEKITDHALSNKKSGGEEVLSSRQQEIADLVLKGKKTLEIASILGIKPSTVSTHKYKIMQKTGSENVLQLRERMSQYPVRC